MPITDPTDLTNLVGWYDGSQLGLSDNTAITSMTDYSGNALHLGSVGGSPKQKTNIQNGLSIVRFVQADSTFARRNGSDSAAFRTNDWTWFLVAIPRAPLNNTSGYLTQQSIFAATHIPGWRVIESTGSTTLDIAVGSSSGHTAGTTPNDGSLAAGTPFILIFDHLESSGANNVYWNATLAASFTRTHGNWSGDSPGLTIGREWTDSSNYGTFDFCECGMYSDVKSSGDRGDLYTYLANKWGIATPAAARLPPVYARVSNAVQRASRW